MIVLGADVGGTSSRVVLFHDGQARGRAEGAGGPMRAGHGEQLAATLAALARQLLLRAGATRADTYVVGASGTGREAERFALEAALDQERVAWKVIVTTDADLARAAAFAGEPGILLIAGTGSIAVVRRADGTDRRVGGLGWRMGDQGSGYWIAIRALTAVGAMHDQLGSPTRLMEGLCTAAAVAGIGGLIRWSTTATTAEVAALAPIVVATADHGDAVAIEIVDEAVGWLVRLAVAAGAKQLPVALSGGLLAPDSTVRRRLRDDLRTEGISVVDRPIDPCEGAPYLARHGPGRA
ncbi:MAG: BadF/BadG/BcrA/BcrD ATPase family protein [Gemmatimonadales bacterium]|nr:BadF/BadG/BcrA/BcrD ATPase family protein [Gemmatimonadales bacterium]